MDKLTFAPVSITLYDEDNEKIATYENSVVRWRVLKQAMRVAQGLGDIAESLNPDALDAVSNFVCGLFGNKFTKEQLEDGADVGEVMAVFHAVVNRAKILGNA